MDRGAWQATVHGVAESDIIEQLSMYACASTHAHTHTFAHAHTHSHMQMGLTGSLMLPSLVLAFCTALILKKKCFRKPLK